MAGVYDVLESKSKFQERGPMFADKLRQELIYRKQHDNQPDKLLIRDYQINAVLETKKYFDDINQPIPRPPALIVAPTGSGKSGMVAMLPYVLECKKVLILSPSMVISKQLAEAFGHYNETPSFFEKTAVISVPKKVFATFLEHVTIIESSQQVLKQRMSNLVIVNAQKFGGNANSSLFNEDKVVVDDVKEFFDQFDTLIVDEAHHYPAKTWQAVVELFTGADKKIVFLTATPYRGDGKKILHDQRETYTISRRDIEGSAIRKSNFHEIHSSYCPVPESFELDDNFCGSLHKYIQDNLKEHNEQEKTIKHQAMVLVRLTSEATDLACSLNKISENASFACAIIGDRNGDDKTRRFREGDFKVAIVCKKLLEGFDNSNVSICVIIRNVRSRVLFNQFVGRCLRISDFPDKHSDEVVAQIMSFQKYEQSTLWNNRDSLAEEDPKDERE